MKRFWFSRVNFFSSLSQPRFFQFFLRKFVDQSHNFPPPFTRTYYEGFILFTEHHFEQFAINNLCDRQISFLSISNRILKSIKVVIVFCFNLQQKVSQGSVVTKLKGDENWFCCQFSSLFNSETVLRIDRDLTKL